jgi:transposase
MKGPLEFDGCFIHREPVDMRRGINGLCDIVYASDMGDIASGRNLFVFCGKRRHSIKILYFDRNRFCLWQTRLEKDLFPWPRKMTDEVVSLTPQQLSLLLEGYDVWKMKPFTERKFESLS